MLLLGFSGLDFAGYRNAKSGRTAHMRRFYRLDVQPDLFGGFLLLKQ
jgi:hypothetical protein